MTHDEFLDHLDMALSDLRLSDDDPEPTEDDDVVKRARAHPRTRRVLRHPAQHRRHLRPVPGPARARRTVPPQVAGDQAGPRRRDRCNVPSRRLMGTELSTRPTSDDADSDHRRSGCPHGRYGSTWYRRTSCPAATSAPGQTTPTECRCRSAKKASGSGLVERRDQADRRGRRGASRDVRRSRRGGDRRRDAQDQRRGTQGGRSAGARTSTRSPSSS